MPSFVVAAFVAAHRWVPPAQEWTDGLPSEVVTVSDCLADFEPGVLDPLTAPWHAAVDDARRAAGGRVGVHALSMCVPSDLVETVEEAVREWFGDHPYPIIENLGRRSAPPAGREIGFEVLGFDSGRFHSWHCYGLRDRGIRLGGYGQLTGLAEARLVSETANRDRGTPGGTPEDVTWFPVRIAEHDAV
ncbi:hypothetical protein AB0G04_05725 [Actinoplanes sp. NPDC023801]|uniref:hypothetical protein n=1 Tax=Actinoplanes sp. NPDC023801 TaxID=3154595 RepID=UPI003407840A